MEYKTNQNEPIDWDDDSGEIHTVREVYERDFKDGWQGGINLNRRDKGFSCTYSKFIGKESGVYYSTDDYRKIIPAYIIATILVIVVCVLMLRNKDSESIVFSIIGFVSIVRMWVKAPYKKWKNQAKRLKEERNKTI